MRPRSTPGLWPTSSGVDALRKYGPLQDAMAVAPSHSADRIGVLHVHPFAQQFYRFEWAAITEMMSGTYGRRDARKAGLTEAGTWLSSAWVAARTDGGRRRARPGASFLEASSAEPQVITTAPDSRSGP